MNLIKKYMLKHSLSHYNIVKIDFSKDEKIDNFDNLILYSLQNDKVVIYEGSIKYLEHRVDFDELLAELTYCIYNSITKGYYDPTYIHNRSEEMTHGKDSRHRTARITEVPVWY